MTFDPFRDRLHRLAARALETAEEERSRLADILQEDVAQQLASFLLQIRNARDLEETDERNRVLEDLRQEAGQALESVRTLARSLRPPELEDIGVENALRALARRTEQRDGPAVEVEIAPVSHGLSTKERRALYCVVHEALLNVRRHAAASRVRLGLWREDRRVVAEIEDDGRGFDVAEAMEESSSALGLFGMQGRARDVDGEVRIFSRPGAGTRVRLELPLSGGPGGANRGADARGSAQLLPPSS